MKRLLIHVEGETEETFVNEVLASHLLGFGFVSVSARIMGNARLRQRRGGIRAWTSVRSDIIKSLRGDAHSSSALMVDYYALPKIGDKAWPGRNESDTLPFEKKSPRIIDLLNADLIQNMRSDFDARRFAPYIMMHEFEGLLFSDCIGFSNGIQRPDLRDKFQQIRNRFETPEMINDSPTTAPSKRIIGLIPNYEKPILGTLAILEIRLDKIRAECPHFNRWLSQLEQMP